MFNMWGYKEMGFFLRKKIIEIDQYRHTLEILWVQFQTTSVKPVSQQSKPHELFGFLVCLTVARTAVS